jgi:hypothetical protein
MNDWSAVEFEKARVKMVIAYTAVGPGAVNAK